MRYKMLQFIAYEIFTGPTVIKTKDITRGYRNRRKLSYTGLENPIEDAKARVNALKTAIEVAEASKIIDSSENTLKTFVAPEFFFRGIKGAYEMDDAQELIGMLQAMVSDKQRWKDWLFVFGSIVGKSERENKEGILSRWFRAPQPLETEAYNFSLIQKGGFGDDKEACQKNSFVVLKEHMSQVDFIRTGELTKDGIALERVHHLAPMLGIRDERQSKNYDGSSIFQLNELTFSLELCLDHIVGRTKKSRNLPEIDVHLIPSCGAKVVPHHIVARPGGIVLHCDGAGFGKTALHMTDTPTSLAPRDGLEIGIDVPHINEIFAQGAGKIHVYDPVPLP